MPRRRTGRVILDGSREAINAWIPDRTSDNALWHIYGLAPGTHTVRLATTGAADSRSMGTTVLVSGAIIYKSR